MCFMCFVYLLILKKTVCCPSHTCIIQVENGDLQKSPQTELIIQFFYDSSCTLLHSFQIASRAALYLVIHCACQVSSLVISLSPYRVQYDIMMKI